MPSSRSLFREFLDHGAFAKAASSATHAKRTGSLRVYLDLLRPYRAAFVKIFIAACLAEIFYLTVPITTRYFIDGVLMPTHLERDVKLALLLRIGGALLVALVAAQAIDFWRRFYTVLVNGRFVRGVRLKLISHLMQIPLARIHELKTGGIVSRLTSDAENLTGLLQMAVISPGVAFLRIAITMAILIRWHLPLALVAAGFVPPLVYISLVYILRVRPIYRSISNDRSTQDARTSEVFAGIRAVKAYGMQAVERRRYNLAQALMLRKNIFAALKESAIDGVWNFLLPVTSLLIIVIGGIFYLRGEASIGDLVAFQMYSGMLLYPVWRMVFSLSQIQKSLASLERVLDMLALDVEENNGKADLPRTIANLRFEHVTFAYRAGQSVLENISFTLKPSRIYAIVGESGVGKTTLIDLLMRFYTPNSGSITLNDRDVGEFDLFAYRRLVALVTQDAILFDGTVRENLLAKESATDARDLAKILEAADAENFVHELPQGLDTLIGERGFKLSGGQRHRLTLARALAKNSPVLVLDEATAHLDTLSEQRIRRRLDTLKRRRIVILITHRLSTASHADEILVLKNKHLEAIGKHRTLLQKSPTYRRLWQAQ